MKFQTWAKLNPLVGQSFTQPSLTIPDQSMSIETLLEKQNKGLTITTGAGIYYDHPVIDVRKLDLTDIEQMKRENYDRLSDAKKQVLQHNVQAKKAEVERLARKAKMDGQLQELIKKMETEGK